MTFIPLSLKYRIALVIFVLEACMITAVLWTTSSESFSAAKRFQVEQEDVFIDVLNELSITALLTEEFGDVQYFLEKIVGKRDVREALLIDVTNKIVASNNVDLIGAKRFPSQNSTLSYWREEDIDSPAGVLGVLAIQFSNEELMAANNKIRNRGISIAVLGMTIILFIGVVVGFALTRRLDKLSVVARAFANGDMNIKSEISGYDEVAELGRTFNEMIESVASAQSQVIREKNQFQLLLDSTAEAILGLDTNNKCIFVNYACIEMLGYENESALLNMAVVDVLKLVSPITFSSSEGETHPEYSSLSIAYKSNGITFPIEYWQHPIVQDGVITGSVITFVDITQTKQKEYELANYRNHLEELVDQRAKTLKKQAQIIDQIHDAVVSNDLDGVITSWNNGATQLFGYEESEMLGRNVEELYFSDSYANFKEKIFSTLIDKGKYDTELRMLKKSGEQFIAYLSLSILCDENEKIIGMIGYSQDITDRKNIEEALKVRTTQLEISNKELSAFSYSVSHDLRSPLRSINGFCHVLLEDYSDKLDEDGRSYLERISNNTIHMGKLIDDMLALSRISRQKMKKQRINLSEISEKVIAELMDGDKERNVSVQISKDIFAHGDEDFLTIALTNLLGNAWKYTRDTSNAEIHFYCEEIDGKLQYCVKDNGAGFDMKYADKLFGAFQRLHHKNEFEGTGIGLATVARIVSRHNGKIWADAEINKGARFCFTLQS